MYQKTNYLTKRKQFNYIHTKGTLICGEFLQIKYTLPKSNDYKIGFSVSKKIGNAVTRNKIKRRLRESFRTMDITISKPFFFVVIAKPQIIDAKYEEIKADLFITINKMAQNENQ